MQSYNGNLDVHAGSINQFVTSSEKVSDKRCIRTSLSSEVDISEGGETVMKGVVTFGAESGA